MTQTKTQARTLRDMRPAVLMTLLLIATLLLTACSQRREDRIKFDGQLFRASAKKVDKRRLDFEVVIRPVSASFEGAREAGRYEATRYCIGNFGTSDVEWIEGPDAEDGTFRVSNDRLTLRGTCAPR